MGGAGWNHEEDTPYGQFLLALRNGDAARFGTACIAARHMIDIDHISYSTDPLRDGAIAPHSRDHVRGATYPSHMWITGITLYYYLTGDPDARAAAIAQAEVNLRFGERGFQYCRNGQWFANLYPLAMVYHMTGEEQYAQAGKVGTLLMMAYHPLDTWCLRELLHFLAIADQRGWIEACAPQNAEGVKI